MIIKPVYHYPLSRSKLHLKQNCVLLTKGGCMTFWRHLWLNGDISETRPSYMYIYGNTDLSSCTFTTSTNGCW